MRGWLSIFQVNTHLQGKFHNGIIEVIAAASNLAARFGGYDRGEAFNTVQALQSALCGELSAGLSAMEAVFAATRVGIPLNVGTELEVLCAAQWQAPGQALRRAFVGG